MAAFFLIAVDMQKFKPELGLLKNVSAVLPSSHLPGPKEKGDATGQEGGRGAGWGWGVIVIKVQGLRLGEFPGKKGLG